MDTLSNSPESSFSEGELSEESVEPIEDIEESKLSYDLDTVIAEITKTKPRSKKQIYIDLRVEELQGIESELSRDEMSHQAQEEWQQMTEKQKRHFAIRKQKESKRYKNAIGDASINPRSGLGLFRSLCYRMIQQRYSTQSCQDIPRLVHKIWKDLPEDTKKRYQQRCSEMKSNYTNGLTRKQKLLQKLKKPRSAWCIYLSDHSKRVCQENPGMNVTGANKILTQEWKKLGEDGQQPYYQRSEGERGRYRLVHELNESGMARKGYNFKNSWMFYRDARIQQINSENWEDRQTYGELNKVISVEWADMTYEEKQPWIEEARLYKEAHQVRLTKQMEDALEAKRDHDAARKTKSAKRD